MPENPAVAATAILRAGSDAASRRIGNLYPLFPARLKPLLMSVDN